MTERDSSQPGGSRARDRIQGGASSEAAIDEALGAWPMAERDAMEWDEAAARVEERIDSGAVPGEISATLTDDDLFAAPLAAERDELGSPDSMSDQPVSVSSRSARPRRSFKDLAELAKSTPPPVLVEAGVGVEAGIAAAAAVEVEAEIAAAAEAPVAVAAVAQAPTGVVVPIGGAKSAAPRAKKRYGLLIANVSVTLAIAAGTIFYLRSPRHDHAPEPVAQTPATATQPAAKPSAAVEPKKDDAIDPMALPLANAPTATTAPNMPVATGVLPMAPPTAPVPIAVASAAPSASAVPSSDPAVASAAPASSGGLEDQMRQAAGPSVSATAVPPTAADTSTGSSGSVPFKPSQGAVSGALGAVMPAARACLDADDPVSHATIVFRSDGSVKSVSIDGGVAGKPQEACVRAALLKAHVPPFAQPEFTGFATIRPN
jgi:hypothetical protein